jgi:hypothetical protein
VHANWCMIISRQHATKLMLQQQECASNERIIPIT